jgi:uncharacterized protein (UPF0262 family)
MMDEPDAPASQERLTHVQIAQDASKPVSHDRLHEQAVAIYDLLDANLFSVIDATGPYHLHLKTDNRHIYFDVRNEHAASMSGFVMALGPFRRIIRDYTQVCTSYYDAIRTRSPSQIQAIDMGRRALHNEGADVLKERLSNYVEIDVQTARRLFTLVYVMTLRG